MKVLVSGSSGLVGSALVSELGAEGHTVSRLVRSRSGTAPDRIFWDPAKWVLDPADLEGYDAIIHLSGENIAGRWTREKKLRIEQSRVESTRLLSEAIISLKQPPKVFLSASAIGYYGNRDDEILTEDSVAGEGFLADLSCRWEDAAKPPSYAGIRVVNLRIGVVLSSRGGALEKMLLPFKLGLGGRVGDGEQYWSWIAMDDLIGAILFALTNDEISGPVNLVSPNPVTNSEFTRVLGKVLNRPTVIPLPSIIARAAFGEMADEALLASVRVVPQKLLEKGFEFQYTDLEAIFYEILNEGD